MARLLLVDNGIDADFYSPVDHWSPHIDIPFDVVRPPGGIFPDSLEPYTHVLLTGSETSITIMHDWVLRELDLIREAAGAGKALFGSCYGHQLIPLALDGPAYVRRAAAPELGWHEVKVTAEDALFKGLPVSFYAFNSHFDEVCNLPPRYKILASSSLCPVHAFRVEGLPVWGVQSHPEIPPDQGARFFARGKELFPEHAALFQRALESPVRYTDICGKLVDNFIHAA